MVLTIKILLGVALSFIIFMWCYPVFEIIKTPEICKLILGIVFCSVIGMFNGKWIERCVDRKKHRDKMRNEWQKLIPEINEQKGISPGGYLGFFERILFFIFAYYNQYVAIGFWLTFKVATKWESWKNVVQVPDKLHKQETNEDAIDWLEAKKAFGGWNMMRFQIGVILNILIGVSAAIFIKNFLK